MALVLETFTHNQLVEALGRQRSIPKVAVFKELRGVTARIEDYEPELHIGELDTQLGAKFAASKVQKFVDAYVKHILKNTSASKDWAEANRKKYFMRRYGHYKGEHL